MNGTSAGRARSRGSRFAAIAGSLLTVVALACDTTEPRRAVALGLMTPPPSNAQSGVVLAQAPVVELRDQDGASFAQSGVTITVSIAAGGGTLGGSPTQTTDADGRVTFPDLVIGGTVGSRTLRFAAQGLTAATSAITLGPGPAATLEAASAATLQATVNTAVATLPSVVVNDASGNPVPDVAVTFTGTSGGGTLTGASQSTNSSGVATLGGWTLPTTAGQYTVNAATTGIAGTGVTFTATANPDAPNAMLPSGGGQSVLYGSRLATPLQVRVVDQYGNPTPGVVVTWGSFSGAGTMEPINVATDASGVVRSNYRLGTVPGANVVRASITSRSLSVDFSATALGFTNEIGLSSHHGCALDEAGVAYCWGQNDYGQVGDGTTTNRLAPVAVGGALRFRRIVAGWGITCALTTDYLAYCWGTNGAGALGDGTRTNRSVPTPVSGGHRFQDISTGNGSATCGVSLAGPAYCWGSNNIGQLGVGTGAPLDNCADPATLTSGPCTLVPMQVAGGHTFASVTTNGTHTCALTPTGELYCWGFIANYGGNFREVPDWAPFRVASGFTFAMVNAGAFHTCGIVSPSSAYCWGNAVDGNLGNGLDEALQETPALVPNIAATQIDGGHGTCAVATDKRAFCWGSNAYGAIGDGTTTGGLVPTPVSSNQPFTAISTSGYATCARVENGQVYCWGYNAQGQLGVGDVFSRLTPALTRP